MVQDYYRELPYGWEVLAENLQDPSHLPFAHHGVLNRRCGPQISMTTSPNKLVSRALQRSWFEKAFLKTCLQLCNLFTQECIIQSWEGKLLHTRSGMNSMKKSKPTRFACNFVQLHDFWVVRRLPRLGIPCACMIAHVD